MPIDHGDGEYEMRLNRNTLIIHLSSFHAYLCVSSCRSPEKQENYAKRNSEQEEDAYIIYILLDSINFPVQLQQKKTNRK